MRISDWSSDVCSSDLSHRRYDENDLRDGPRNRIQRPPFPVPSALQATNEHQQEFGCRAASLRRGRTNHPARCRSEEHTSELQSLMRISYAVFCLKKKKTNNNNNKTDTKQLKCKAINNETHNTHHQHKKYYPI